MSTILFDSIIFGPVKSRRLGISLGINVLPIGCKQCNFNCVYCECGLNKSYKNLKVLPSRKDVRRLLEERLCEIMVSGEKIDVITFAGNGEPTLHPEFNDIVSDVIFLKEAYSPTSKVAVLSNATQLHKKEVFDALLKVDMNVLKLDSAVDETFLTINQPIMPITVEDIILNIKKFNGKFILQTMFVHGKFNNIEIDNTTDYEVEQWLKLIKVLKPQMVMVYTINREPAIAQIQKVPITKMQEIAQEVKKLGVKVKVSG